MTKPIKRARSKTWRKSAPEKLADAQRALAPLRPPKGQPAQWATRDRNGTWRDGEGDELHAAVAVHYERHVVENEKAVKGAASAAGKDQPGAKTRRSRAKYVRLIATCDERGVPLGKPYTDKRLDAVMAIAVELNLATTRGAVLKHLQRHHKS